MTTRLRTWFALACLGAVVGCSWPRVKEVSLAASWAGLAVAHAAARPSPDAIISAADAVLRFMDILVNVEAAQPPPLRSSPRTPIPLSLEIAIFKESFDGARFLPVRVNDGDVLYTGEKYKLAVRPHVECWVYIAQSDSTGQVYPLFPSHLFAPAVSQPLRARQIYQVPSIPTLWTPLDENTGRERIYFIASRTRRTDIEDVFRRLDGAWAKARAGEIQLPRVNMNREYSEDRLLHERGPRRETAPGVGLELHSAQGQMAMVQPDLFRTLGAEFVLMRWFEHR